MQYRRARRKFDDEPENHERWLISYADFITHKNEKLGSAGQLETVRAALAGQPV